MPAILIVDDDMGVREALRMQLATMGHDADAAGTGHEALMKLCARTAADRLYQVIILDIVMPGIDGWQVLKAIKYNPLWKDIRVIVISGHANGADDLTRIIEFDGVFVEKRAGFVEMVSDVLERVLQA
jgi:twitching motility two-component system response regulator PilH